MKTIIQIISKIYNKFFDGDISENPVRNFNCVEFEVDKYLISKFILKRILPKVGITPYLLDELMLMTATVCYFKPQYIFEWGTHVGKSARIFYEISRNYKTGSLIHSIDLPDNVSHVEHPRKKRGKYIRHISQISLYQGDGITKSLEIYNKLNPVKTDLFYLDGDHSYESVTRELHLIAENVEKAIILIHDTFSQSSQSNYNIGPFLAIKDFLNEHPGSFKYLLTNLGLPGMTLLYK